MTEQPALATEVDALDARYGGAGGVLFLARWRGIAVGTVAVRFHDDGSAELKRMYVRPVARGRGVADSLVQAVLAAAGAHGRRRVWLDTLPGVMDAAMAVYRRNGFVPAVGGEPTLGVDGIVALERVVEAAVRCA